MTKFERIGVDHQLSSLGIADAQRKMSNSCDLCCRRNLTLDCDHCAIRECHRNLLGAFADRARRELKEGERRWRLSVC